MASGGPVTSDTPDRGQLISELLHPSPGMVLVFLILVLTGRTGETALAICLILTVE